MSEYLEYVLSVLQGWNLWLSFRQIILCAVLYRCLPCTASLARGKMMMWLFHWNCRCQKTSLPQILIVLTESQIIVFENWLPCYEKRKENVSIHKVGCFFGGGVCLFVCLFLPKKDTTLTSKQYFSLENSHYLTAISILSISMVHIFCFQEPRINSNIEKYI